VSRTGNSKRSGEEVGGPRSGPGLEGERPDADVVAPGSGTREPPAPALTVTARRYVPWLIAAAAILLTFVVAPALFRPGNLANVTRQASPLLVLAVAQTIVLVSRGIDLSQAAVMQAAAIGLVVWVGSGVPVGVAFLGVLALGAGIGLLNGVFVSYGRMPPFIATLAVGITVTGVRLVTTGGTASGSVPPFVRQLAVGRVGGIAYGVIVAAGIAFLVHVVTRRTTAGRRLYAVGANPEVSRASGIRVPSVLIATYTGAGFLAAFAGLLLAGNVGFADRNIGTGAELDSIAAAVIGGATFAGGQGTVVGTVAGVVVLSLLLNLVLLLGLPAGVQEVVKGVVIIGGLAMYQRMRRQAARQPPAGRGQSPMRRNR
jgi:ribose/xylose/arabinose/galactoside ABC-type transport system permease subunit